MLAHLDHTLNVAFVTIMTQSIYRLLGYERVYLPHYKIVDTPFHIQGDDIQSKLVFFLKLQVYSEVKCSI